MLVESTLVHAPKTKVYQADTRQAIGPVVNAIVLWRNIDDTKTRDNNKKSVSGVPSMFQRPLYN